MKKTLNALLICGSFSISNAQTVLDALEPVPYKIEETRVEKIRWLATTGCGGAESKYFDRREYNTTEKTNYISTSWISLDDAKKKIDEDFGSELSEKKVDIEQSCGVRSQIKVLRQRYYRPTKDTYGDHRPCTGIEVSYDGINARRYEEFISSEYIYGETYTKYLEMKEQLEKRNGSKFVGRCNIGETTWNFWWYDETSVQWNNGYADERRDIERTRRLK